MIVAVSAISGFNIGCVASYAFASKDRPQSIAYETDSAAPKESPVSTVCFPNETSGESADDSCFGLDRRVQWYFDHAYPARYTVFYYRQFGVCPPYTYYAPDCDCCRRAAPMGDSPSKSVEESPVHASGPELLIGRNKQ